MNALLQKILIGVLMGLGGFLVHKGFFTSDQLSEVVSAVVVVIGAWWTYKHNQKDSLALAVKKGDAVLTSEPGPDVPAPLPPATNDPTDNKGKLPGGLPLILVGFISLGLCGCTTGASGITSSTSTVFGIEIAYNTGETMPSIKAGLIRHEYVRTGTNTNFQILKATDSYNSTLFSPHIHTVTAIGETAVKQDSAAKHMEK